MSAASSLTPVRAVGLVSLTAISLNGIVGAGIFSLPAGIAQVLGPASPLAYLAAGAAIILIALCFAEAGSTFEQTGGPYLYGRTALGSFIGFQTGWMFAVARLTAVAAISNTFADYVTYFIPWVAGGVGRIAAVTLMIGALAVVNYRGIRFGVTVINALTIGKMVPLLAFCLVGFFFLDSSRFTFTELPPVRPLQQASLVLLFAFGGFESASVPSEEVLQPRKILPLAMTSAVAIAVVLYLAIQVVAMGTLPELARNVNPLASAASTFLGPAGAVMLTIGAIFSTSGTSTSSMMVGSRMLYAMAQGDQLPAFFGKLHEKFRTPAGSVVVCSVGSWILAISGTFTQLAPLSALARLLFYGVTCLSIPILRRKMPAASREFTLAGGPLIPVLALGICAWLFAGTTRSQAMILLGGVAAGCAVQAAYAIARKRAAGFATFRSSR